jgi:hypothetical protein
MGDSKFEAMLKKAVNPGKCREELVGNGEHLGIFDLFWRDLSLCLCCIGTMFSMFCL